MKDYDCHLILFRSTHQALRAEQALKNAGIEHAVINTPREFSVDCGISLRIDLSARQAAIEALRESGVLFADVVPYRSRLGGKA